MISDKQLVKIESNETSPHLPEAETDRPGAFTRASATIHYWVTGDANAPTVVCTHGVTLDHGTFAAQAPVLRDAGYRVVTWDVRGHGLSRPSRERLRISVAVEDLNMLLDEVGAEQAVLVGESFGGAIIQEFYRCYPQRVAALVLVGAPALGDRLPWYQRIVQRGRPFLLRLWPEAHLRRVIPAFMSARADVQRYVAQAIQPLDKMDFVWVTEAALEGLLELDPLPTVAAPVLLVHGEDEMPMVARLMQARAARDPQMDLAVVDDAGHLVHNDNPAAFNDVLLAFLRRALNPMEDEP